VLVVDDCKDNANTLKLLVKLWGYDVEVAYDAEAAIDTARAYLPDVICLDIGLPNMDGCEAVRRLRSKPGVQDALMVAVTGYADPRHRRQAMEAGFDLYLVKPVAPAVLHGVLMRSSTGTGGAARPL
jgi:two-component system CheB/CheR fusion protein